MQKNEYRNLFENQTTHWWYLGMGEINIALLKKYLPKRKRLEILDAGCGTGSAFWYLKKFGKVTGVDISPEALKFARKIGKVKKGDVTFLPFKNSSFDLVACLDVLYHLWVKDYRLAIKEFHRILKPGGFLLLREPAFEWLKSSHDIVDYGQRRFLKKEINNSLKSSSFEILKLSYANFFLFPLVLLKRLPEIVGLRKRQVKSDVVKTPRVINFFFFNLLRLEAFLLRYINLPFGSSIICLAKK